MKKVHLIILEVLFWLVSTSMVWAYPQLPELNWAERSDWINVKTDVSPAAVGDGVADDTAALQAALNMIGPVRGDPKTVYLPPGTYRITAELSLSSRDGAMIVGHGRTTTIRWDGATGGRMYRSEGVAHSWCIGLTWDGREIAAIGFEHDAETQRETKNRVQYCCFQNFTDTGWGIAPDKPDQRYAEGGMIENCLFINCGKGVAISQWNDYEHLIENCNFYDCGTAVWCIQGTFVLRNCHFEGSTVEDVYINSPSHGYSLHHCTSVGSRVFIQAGNYNGWANTTDNLRVQDCHVSGWTHSDYAIYSRFGGTMLVYDCVFTDPPSTNPPIWLGNPILYGYPQRLVIANNSTATTELVNPGVNSSITEIPAGNRGGIVQSANQSFFREQAAVPGVVFDARLDFGAKGDGSDDTAACQATIDAARNYGNGAIAYFPSGQYDVYQSLNVTGGNYYIGGSGYHSIIKWRGTPATGPLFIVEDPQNVTMEKLALCTAHTDPDLWSIRQQNCSASSFMRYEGLYLPRGVGDGGLHCVDLPKDAVVLANCVYGKKTFTNCSRATILGNLMSEGCIRVEGQTQKDGFIGILCAFNTGQVIVNDNQDLVVEDMYCEQATIPIVEISGNTGDPSGRVTIAWSKLHMWENDNDPINIDNYQGRYCNVGAQFGSRTGGYEVNPTGDRPVDVIFAANIMSGVTFDLDTGATLTLIENFGQTNIIPAGRLQEAAYALDHFRELSEYDFAFNHAPTLVPYVVWLAQYGLSVGEEYTDKDGDGMTAHDEYVAGTDPTSSSSVLKITSAALDSPSWFGIKWSSVAGRVYDVEHSTNLLDALSFEPLLTDIRATPSTNSCSVPFFPDGQHFFRVKVKLAP